MTGYLYCTSNIVNSKYLRYQIKLSNKSYLNFEDIRKFGGFYYLKNLKKLKNRLGCDPFSEKFTFNWLKNTLQKKKTMIKPLLLRQDLVCGLGNIYIDEILWDCKIHPEKISSKIKKNKIDELIFSIRRNLNKSIKYHGTTIMNFKFDNMKSGNYKSKLKAYGLNETPCYRCKNNIIKKKLCGRTSFYCPSCQKL